MNAVFYQILGNNLAANVTNFTVWFAITFWVFLETQSVFATGTIAGVYLILTAGSGFWFGSIVDHNSKRLVMLGSSAVSAIFYVFGLALLVATPDGVMRNVASPQLWIFILLVMAGVIVGNIRGLALVTLVTLLIPEDKRDRANGLVGMIGGVGFLTTSVISGFLVAWGGMFYTLIFALAVTAVAFGHLAVLRIREEGGAGHKQSEAVGAAAQPKSIDLAGTIALIAGVPGLFALIIFATFNNMLGGIFMALLDAYGLSLVSVQTWGLLFGVLSCAFIVSGIAIARLGLGKRPLRTLMLVNCVTWSVCCVFTLQSSIWLLGAGMFVWMLLGPYAEASEHTTLQKVVPYERQGRVFGFAQTVELSASPLTAFLIGPLTQFFFIPFMTDGAGAAAIGDWFGTGPARGMALVFTLSGVIGLVVTIIAFNSKYYRLLSEAYAKAPDQPEQQPAAAS